MSLLLGHKVHVGGRTTYFQTDFETADASLVPPFNTATARASLNTNPAFSRQGNNSGQLHYNVSVDDNQYVVYYTSTPINHFFARGYVYFKTPEVGLPSHIDQRKLNWFADGTNATGDGQNFTTSVVAWTDLNGSFTPTHMYLSLLGQGGSCYGIAQTTYDETGISEMNWDTWYCIETECKLNTPSVSGPYDGIFRVWLNGVKVFDDPAFKVNGNCSGGFNYFSFGRQVDDSDAVDEYRYWDDIIISASQIGT